MSPGGVPEKVLRGLSAFVEIAAHQVDWASSSYRGTANSIQIPCAPANPPKARETRFAVKWHYSFVPGHSRESF
jgi:hypothetical protein